MAPFMFEHVLRMNVLVAILQLSNLPTQQIIKHQVIPSLPSLLYPVD